MNDPLNRWSQSFNSNVGKVTLLVPPGNPNRPAHIPPGYEWELPEKEVREMQEAIRRLFKSVVKKVQCELLQVTSRKHGVRLHIFVLAYRPGLCGPNSESEGITKEEWESLVLSLDKELSRLSGSLMYFEKWSDTRKFQIRFEAVIAFQKI